MIIPTADGSMAHFPNHEYFEFDKEVASVFDSMALRSIPGYPLIHEYAVDLAIEKFKKAKSRKEIFRIIDVGASTGMFSRRLWKKLGVNDLSSPIEGLEVVAVDPSQPMVDMMRINTPVVDIRNLQMQELKEVCQDYGPFHFGVCFFVVQFIPLEQREEALGVFSQVMDNGAIVAFAHKEAGHYLDEFLTAQYIQFRLLNGYTSAEIQAKTEALKKSMWVSTAYEYRMLERLCGFEQFESYCRHLQFEAHFAVKR